MKRIITIIIIASMLVGCAATGSNLRGDVYRSDQVNTTQSARGIKILKIMPAQVEVDNTKQKRTAQIGGAILGAVAGGLAGGFGGIGSLATAGTAATGGVIGAAAGSLVDDKILVQGVTIGYSEHERMFTSTQVGEPCEFKLGDAVIVATDRNETRVQSNATCPVVK